MKPATYPATPSNYRLRVSLSVEVNAGLRTALKKSDKPLLSGDAKRLKAKLLFGNPRPRDGKSAAGGSILSEMGAEFDLARDACYNIGG